MTLIVPSLLAFDLSKLRDAVDAVEQAGARRIHVDVCDGHLAPGITVGQPVIASLRRATGIELEVHLRVERPERFVADFIGRGASRIAIQPESTVRLWQALSEIRTRGCRCGAALNPATPLEAVGPVLRELDFLLLLAEEPEWSIAGLTERVRSAAEARSRCGGQFEIAVDGTIDPEYVPALEDAGTDLIVMNGVTARNPHPGMLLRELMRQAAQSRGFAAVDGVFTGSDEL